MSRITYAFDSKEGFKEAVELFGEPPCRKCLVQPSCYEKNEYSDSFELCVDEGCKDMYNWVIDIKNNLFSKQIEKLKNDSEYRTKITEKLVKILEEKKEK